MVRTVLLSLLATLFVCGGSYIVIQAPGDGQTGMVAFPLWAMGAVAAAAAIIPMKTSAAARAMWPVVAICALIAVGSIIQSFWTCNKYEDEWSNRQKHKLANEAKQAPNAKSL